MMKILLLLTLLSFNAQAKRAAPAVIKPLVKNGITYDIKKDVSDCKDKDKVCGMTVSLVSLNKDKSENWKRELYIKHYDLNEERDVQDIHPKSMKFEKNDRIKVVDEKGAEYLLEASNGKMIKPLKTILYMAKP